MGWAQIRADRSAYVGVEDGGLIDRLDDELVVDEARLVAELGTWLQANAPTPHWSLVGAYNNVRGILQYWDSSNHRSRRFYEMLDFIAAQSPGNHGIFYVHDDEVRGQEIVYRVWRIFEGKVTEHDDPHFSPLLSPYAFGGGF